MGQSPTPSHQTIVRPKKHYHELLWQTLRRQLLLYFLPLILLALFFHIQYRTIVKESRRAHLEVIAEHQANTLDLFLQERHINLANAIDDPNFSMNIHNSKYLASTLSKLKQTSAAFIDIGVVDEHGQ